MTIFMTTSDLKPKGLADSCPYWLFQGAYELK